MICLTFHPIALAVITVLINRVNFPENNYYVMKRETLKVSSGNLSS